MEPCTRARCTIKAVNSPNCRIEECELTHIFNVILIQFRCLYLNYIVISAIGCKIYDEIGTTSWNVFSTFSFCYLMNCWMLNVKCMKMLMRTEGSNEKEWKIIIINDTSRRRNSSLGWGLNENENTEDNISHLRQVIKYICISNECCPRAHSFLQSILCSFRKWTRKWLLLFGRLKCSWMKFKTKLEIHLDLLLWIIILISAEKFRACFIFSFNSALNWWFWNEYALMSLMNMEHGERLDKRQLFYIKFFGFQLFSGIWCLVHNGVNGISNHNFYLA